MTALAWLACLAWLTGTASVAAISARRGLREGRGARAAARLKSPTVYLFAAYLLIAAWVTPPSPGESTSPLLWLGLMLPLAYAAATLTAIGRAEPTRLRALALGLLHGGAVIAAATIILALSSPGFVPWFLRR